MEPGSLISWLQFSLMVAFPAAPLGIFLFCTCVIAIGVVQVGCPSAHAVPSALGGVCCRERWHMGVTGSLPWAQLSGLQGPIGAVGVLGRAAQQPEPPHGAEQGLLCPLPWDFGTSC